MSVNLMCSSDTAECVLNLSGVIAFYEARQFHLDCIEAVDKALEGDADLHVDAGQVERIGAAGLQVLLATHNSMAKRGRKLILHGVPEAVLDALELAGLSHIFHFEAENGERKSSDA